jgi:hypothetical protein
MKHIEQIELFCVNASQSLAVWRKNGWIYEFDPRGWFQWYCRYYMDVDALMIIDRYKDGE